MTGLLVVLAGWVALVVGFIIVVGSWVLIPAGAVMVVVGVFADLESGREPDGKHR